MRILHTMIRVSHLERSVAFYRDILGMRVLSQKDYPSGEFTLVFLGYQEIDEGPVLELTYNWFKDRYDLGDGYGHIAIAVDDIHKICDEIKHKGGKVAREPGPMKYGGTTAIAFVEDPDGYKIELIERD